MATSAIDAAAPRVPSSLTGLWLGQSFRNDGTDVDELKWTLSWVATHRPPTAFGAQIRGAGPVLGLHGESLMSMSNARARGEDGSALPYVRFFVPC